MLGGSSVSHSTHDSVKWDMAKKGALCPQMSQAIIRVFWSLTSVFSWHVLHSQVAPRGMDPWTVKPQETQVFMFACIAKCTS